MSWVWFFWIFVVIHGLIFQSITDAVAKKRASVDFGRDRHGTSVSLQSC